MLSGLVQNFFFQICNKKFFPKTHFQIWIPNYRESITIYENWLILIVINLFLGGGGFAGRGGGNKFGGRGKLLTLALSLILNNFSLRKSKIISVKLLRKH